MSYSLTDGHGTATSLLRHAEVSAGRRAVLRKPLTYAATHRFHNRRRGKDFDDRSGLPYRCRPMQPTNARREAVGMGLAAALSVCVGLWDAGCASPLFDRDD